MANKLIELENFLPVPHAAHILSKKKGDVIEIHFFDKHFNNQGGMELSIVNAKLLVKELRDEINSKSY